MEATTTQLAPQLEQKQSVTDAAESIYSALTGSGYSLDEKLQVKDELRMLLQTEAEQQLADQERAYQEAMSNLKKLRASI